MGLEERARTSACAFLTSSLVSFPLSSEADESLEAFCARRALAVADDLWDFGTVRHMHPRADGPATIRRRQQQQQYEQHQSHLPQQQHSRAPPQPPHHRSAPAPALAPVAAPVRSHDFADTVRGAPSAHSEYDDYSSAASSAGGGGAGASSRDADARARAALDRERERLERLRIDERERAFEREREELRAREAAQQQEMDEEEGGGEILDTVVLPVLDSVRRRSTRSLFSLERTRARN